MIRIEQKNGYEHYIWNSSTKVMMEFYTVNMTSIYSNINKWIHIIHTIETFTDCYLEYVFFIYRVYLPQSMSVVVINNLRWETDVWEIAQLPISCLLPVFYLSSRHNYEFTSRRPK